MLGFTSCDFSHDELYEEPITSALFVLTPDTGTTVILQYLDRDGEGGRPAIINSASLKPKTSYQAELLLNTMGKHIIDTTSIARNPENYQVFFLPQDGLKLTPEYNDYDANGFPVGLNSIISTGTESEGQLMVIIKYKPNKAATGVAAGDITNAGGKTSFEISFDITVLD
jgi:hypothetical protein